MTTQEQIGVGGFLVWVLLGIVTFGIYTLWWQYSRMEAVYRAVAKNSR